MRMIARFQLEIKGYPKDYRGATMEEFEIISMTPTNFPLWALGILFKLVTFYWYTHHQEDTDDLNQAIWQLAGALGSTKLLKHYHYGEINPQRPRDYIKEAQDDQTHG